MRKLSYAFFISILRIYTYLYNLEDGIEMAEDALALILYGYETEKRKIPAPSDRSALEVPAGSFVNYIRCDTMAYRKVVV